MTAWTFERIWTAVRDVASWGLGAWWGNGLMAEPHPDPLKIAVVSALLGLPFAAHADAQRRRAGRTDPPSTNGQGPEPSSERASL